MAGVILDRIIRVGIVDDNELVRRTLHSILDCSQNLNVIAEIENDSAAISLVKLMLPDAVLMDISMPVLDGIEATRVLSSQLPETKVIVLTMHVDQTDSDTLLQAGACRFLTEDSGRENSSTPLKNVHQGRQRLLGTHHTEPSPASCYLLFLRDLK